MFLFTGLTIVKNTGSEENFLHGNIDNCKKKVYRGCNCSSKLYLKNWLELHLNSQRPSVLVEKFIPVIY